MRIIIDTIEFLRFIAMYVIGVGSKGAREAVRRPLDFLVLLGARGGGTSPLRFLVPLGARGGTSPPRFFGSTESLESIGLE